MGCKRSRYHGGPLAATRQASSFRNSGIDDDDKIGFVNVTQGQDRFAIEAHETHQQRAPAFGTVKRKILDEKASQVGRPADGLSEGFPALASAAVNAYFFMSIILMGRWG